MGMTARKIPAFSGRLERLPPTWDPAPKGCWAAHPMSGVCCQLPPDDHSVHKTQHPDGLHLECWWKPSTMFCQDTTLGIEKDCSDCVDKLEKWARAMHGCLSEITKKIARWTATGKAPPRKDLEKLVRRAAAQMK